MRKLCLVMLSAGALALAAGPAAARIGVSVAGGYARIAYGDFNDWAELYNSYAAGTPDAGITEWDKINWVPEAAVEFSLSIAPTVSGGLGIGYLKGSSGFKYDFGADYFGSGAHSMRAVPITATARWEPPLVALKPYLFGGLGIYHAKLTFESSSTEMTESESAQADLAAWGFGLHGGAGVRFPVAPAVALDLGVRVRWANVSGFRGSQTDGSGETYEVYLVRDKVADPDAGLIEYYGAWPDGGRYAEGSVDLSGFTIYVGISAGF